VLVVSDVRSSVEHYARAFGFEEDFLYGSPPIYAGVGRGDVVIHLQAASTTQRPVGGGCVSLFVGDAMAAHAELVERGAPIAVPPAPRDYGLIDFVAEDPDGNQLVWGSEAGRGE